MQKFIAFLLTVTALSGCSTMVTHESVMTSLAGTPSCCESMAYLHYQEIGFGEIKKLTLDASSDAYQFPSGKSYVAAVRLPPFTGSYKIAIQSFALGETIDTAHIFYPQVVLLDDKFSVVESSSPQAFVLSKASFFETAQKTWGLPVKLEGSIVVYSPDSKYMVVYTTTELLNSTSPYETMRFVSVILPGIVGAIPTGKEVIAIQHSPFGLLYIVVGKAAD